MNKIFLTILILLPSISQADITSGCVGWWKLDEASGNVSDSSGGNNTGTPTGTTVVNQCSRNRCRSLNGTTDFINVGNVNAIGGLTRSFTVSAWINTTTVAAGVARVIATARTNGNNGWAFGRSGAKIRLTTFSVKDYDTIGSFVVANRWRHIAAVMGAADDVDFYADGVFKETISGAVQGVADAADSTFLGAGTVSLSGTLNELWNGSVDDIRVFNRELTAQDIKDLYNEGIRLRNAKISGTTVLNQ